MKLPVDVSDRGLFIDNNLRFFFKYKLPSELIRQLGEKRTYLSLITSQHAKVIMFNSFDGEIMAEYAGNPPYNPKLRRRGDKVTLFINDQLMFSFNLKSYTNGISVL